MTNITLPPDLEVKLTDEARRRGTTPELLALEGLRRLFAVEVEPANTGNLYDFLGQHLGSIAGTSEPFSEDCGRRFADGLVDKQQQGRV